MKKLKDLDVHVIEDKNALTIKGGDCGTSTLMDRGNSGTGPIWFGDWDDEFCC
ncbi:hypothetical protein [Aquimarina atlantica]|uniref:hypothetical protein n=1 Tax=Aquimarina atlantica TaxID=1317122 RepID=UPI000A69A58F|nr:hypothetical protein [Aquimarina atlantica]